MSKLKKIRVGKGMSITELSKITDITPAYISLLENDKRKNPSLAILKKIAEALDTPLAELI